MNSIRTWLNNNSAITTTIAIAFLCVSVVIMIYFTTRNPTKVADKFYYFDLNSGQLFADSVELIPPIDAPSGPGNGVRAMVYGCGGCSESQRHLVYLMKAKDAAAAKPAAAATSAKTDKGPPASTAPMMIPMVISKPDKINWVGDRSAEGRAIMAEVDKLCQSKNDIVMPCIP